MRCLIFVLCGFMLTMCNTQSIESNRVFNKSLHTGLTEKIGNFSIELLYFTTLAQERAINLIISPITVWTILAVISEGASDKTMYELNDVLRINPKHRRMIRRDYQDIAKWLQVKTTTVELQKLNAMFVDEDQSPLKDFVDVTLQYDTRVISVNFSNPDVATNSINNLISTVTHGRIPELVNTDDIKNSNLILTSALYFKGQWSVPFNSSFTSKESFYDSSGKKKIGEVNMMYNRHTYPFANIKSLQARILEIPYGKDNRLSMLIMLPNSGVSLNEMFYNLANITLDTVFDELKVSVEEYADDEVECLIPRFKIESNLELRDTLFKMGIHDLFDVQKARLPLIASYPLYVSRVIHKAEIEVTEEGTVASAVTASEFGNRIGAIRFEANRPFCYLIIEKVTNSIAFGGFYNTPSLY